jgi:hypothetical protein
MRHEQKLIAKKRSFVTFKLETIAHSHILREFQPLKNHVPEIHLSGEDDVETEKISDEIKLMLFSITSNIRVTQRYVR